MEVPEGFQTALGEGSCLGCLRVGDIQGVDVDEVDEGFLSSHPRGILAKGGHPEGVSNAM